MLLEKVFPVGVHSFSVQSIRSKKHAKAVNSNKYRDSRTLFERDPARLLVFQAS